MSDNNVRLSAALIALRTLQKQFEHRALEHARLEHHYSEHQLTDEPPVTASRFQPPPDYPYATGLLRSSVESYVDGVWCSLLLPDLEPPLIWTGWYIGEWDAVTKFLDLADSASQFIKNYRVKPPLPDWLNHALSKSVMNYNIIARNAIIVPNERHRWVRFLHWLGWSGDVMAITRESWNMLGAYDLDSRPILAPGATEHRTYSKIDNLFLRSVAAIDWMLNSLENPAGASSIETANQENRTLRTATISSGTSTPSEEAPLSEDQRDFLVALLELGAFGSDSRKTAEEIVTKAKGNYAYPPNAKNAFSDLVKKGLLRSRTGRNGGYWLTEAGLARAERIKRC